MAARGGRWGDSVEDEAGEGESTLYEVLPETQASALAGAAAQPAGVSAKPSRFWEAPVLGVLRRLCGARCWLCGCGSAGREGRPAAQPRLWGRSL